MLRAINGILATNENFVIREDTAEDQHPRADEISEGGENFHWTMYSAFLRAATFRLSLLFFFCLMFHFACLAARSIWLSKWSDEAATVPANASMSVVERLGVYALIGTFEVIGIIFALTFFVLAMQAASLNLHHPLLHSILRSPIRFFDVTPIGRILTRLSGDLEMLDVQFPQNFRQFILCAYQTVIIILMISYSTPIFVVAIVPLFAVYFFILRYFIPSARQLKRLESIKRAPILSSFSESIIGAASIRAYGKVDETCTFFGENVDRFIQCKHLTLATNRWLGIRLELLGSTVVLLSALIGVLMTRVSSISPGLVGLSVSFALNITEQLNLGVRMLSDVETNIVSVERIKEFSSLEEEMEWRSDCPPDEQWPSKGKITLTDYSTRYREHLPLVLNNLSFGIEAGEKIAVVGRTGSGKSSLTLALFRLIEPVSGQISIDNIDIYNIGLHDLREKLTIIPQEPVLFSGTVRFNLDPFSKHSDAEIWSALEACQLRAYVESHNAGLEFAISEGGKNMSVGQRQLMCLGRALLRKGRILILDEATAAVDVATDALVQQVIRERFADATVIAIAHRLNTVAGYDRIMVLRNGELAEFDSPSNLLANKDSHYSRLIEKSRHRR